MKNKIFLSFVFLFVTSLLFPLMAQPLSDQEITNALQSKYNQADFLDMNRLVIDTDQGIVRLKGETNDLLAAHKAEDIAMAVSGVRGVVNLLQVKPPQKVHSSSIKKRIEEVLTNQLAPSIENLQIEVVDGEVTLQGIARSWQESQLASKETAAVLGVTGDENNISFKPLRQRPDDTLEAEILRILKMNVRIDADLVNVDVDEGKVDLSGTVGSAWEKSYAREVSWVTGVDEVEAEDLIVAEWARKEVFRKSKYTGVEPFDIASAINDAFLYDPRVYSFNINVSLEGGVATLSGEVDNLKAKKAASATAQNIIGVWEVKNELTVAHASAIPDSAIVNQIQEGYEWDPYLNNRQVDVTVYEDTVYLDGALDNYFQKYQAADIAGSVKGVSEVINRITVEDDYPVGYYSGWVPQDSPIPVEAPLPDDEIKTAINQQYIWSPFVDEDEVKITVENGQAILSGTVDTWTEYRYAEKNAYEGGAIFVDNNLEVDQDLLND